LEVVLLCSAIECLVLQIMFVRNGDLSTEKTWFIYAAGSCIVMECIFTNILLFR